MTAKKELEYVIDDLFSTIYSDMMECNPESDAEDFYFAIGDRLCGEDMSPELRVYYSNLDGKEVRQIINSRLEGHF